MKTDYNKKGMQVGDMLGIGMTLVVFGIGIAYGLSVLGEIRDDEVTDTAGCNATEHVNCSASYNASQKTIEGVGKLATKLPTIVTIVIAAIIIGILVRYLWIRYN